MFAPEMISVVWITLWMLQEGAEEEVGTQRSLLWDLWSVTFLES